MACVTLVKLYVAENVNKPVPIRDIDTTDADWQTLREEWLKTDEWTCYDPISKNFTINCENVEEPVYFIHNTEPEERRPIVYKGKARSFLKQTGFMNWINQRGGQCINHVTGLLTPYDKEWNFLTPSQTVGHPLRYCTKECLRYTSTSDPCFVCVKKVLEDPIEYPFTIKKTDPNNSDQSVNIETQNQYCTQYETTAANKTLNTDDIRQAVECQTEIGSMYGGLHTMKDSDIHPTGKQTVYDPTQFNKLWSTIINGTPHYTFPIWAIILIVVMGLATIFTPLFIMTRVTDIQKSSNVKY